MVNASKTAVMMLNMGGPSTTHEVHDFLLRLFQDSDIIKLPVQKLMSQWIARKRTPEVIKKYEEIGGGSPIGKWTNQQGRLLAKRLDDISPATAPHKHFIGFRYANPLTENTLDEILSDGYKRVLLFSQYPQYSCATSGSSLNAIYRHLKSNKAANDVRWSVIDRWPTHPSLVKTFADNIRQTMQEFPPEVKKERVVILFSAHSIPMYVVKRGDTYPAEVAATVTAVMEELEWSNPYRLVWQSKVGPMPWLEPSTEQTMKGLVERGRRDMLLVPIAFTSEHIETLHELDIEYGKELAEKIGARHVKRAPAPNDHPLFIEALSDIAKKKMAAATPISPQLRMRCPQCTNPTCQQMRQWLLKVNS